MADLTSGHRPNDPSTPPYPPQAQLQAVPQPGVCDDARTRTRASRRRVITVAILAQALILSGAWYLAYHTFKKHVAGTIEQLVLAKNVDTADMLASAIAELGPEEIKHGTPHWRKLQTLVEETKLVSGGFACILDKNGNVLCHPDLNRQPELLGMPMAEKLLETPDGRRVALGDADEAGVLAGRIVMSDRDMHYVATRAVPNINGQLTVHQPRQGLVQAGELATGHLVIPGAVAGAMVLILTTFISSFLMRRHDRALEWVNQGLEADVRRRVAQATQTRDALIIGLAKLADYRDNDTGLHLDRIAAYTTLLAERLIDPTVPPNRLWIDTLRIASSMHDIGKVGIPDAVLLKPGKLTPGERRTIQRHPIIGTDTLIAVHRAMGSDDLVEMSMRVSLYHHERWDGQGYPTSLSGESIPLEARIVAVADVYDALTCKRVYKEAMPHGKAVALIREGSGTQFDPTVVAAFLEVQAAFDQTRQELTRKESAVGCAA